MSAKIEINQNQLTKNKELELDFLPAKIEGKGSANANEYFKNYTRTENSYLHNALRGYPLCGTEIDVPKKYMGLLLQEPNERIHDKERTLRVTGTFSKFTYWNYDKIPSKADGYNQALEWCQIAADMAQPVSENDVIEEMKSHEKKIASKENTNS